MHFLNYFFGNYCPCSFNISFSPFPFSKISFAQFSFNKYLKMKSENRTMSNFSHFTMSFIVRPTHVSKFEFIWTIEKKGKSVSEEKPSKKEETHKKVIFWWIVHCENSAVKTYVLRHINLCESSTSMGKVCVCALWV